MQNIHSIKKDSKKTKIRILNSQNNAITKLPTNFRQVNGNYQKIKYI